MHLKQIVALFNVPSKECASYFFKFFVNAFASNMEIFDHVKCLLNLCDILLVDFFMTIYSIMQVELKVRLDLGFKVAHLLIDFIDKSIEFCDEVRTFNHLDFIDPFQQLGCDLSKLLVLLQRFVVRQVYLLFLLFLNHGNGRFFVVGNGHFFNPFILRVRSRQHI